MSVSDQLPNPNNRRYNDVTYNGVDNSTLILVQYVTNNDTPLSQYIEPSKGDTFVANTHMLIVRKETPNGNLKTSAIIPESNDNYILYDGRMDDGRHKLKLFERNNNDPTETSRLIINDNILQEMITLNMIIKRNILRNELNQQLIANDTINRQNHFYLNKLDKHMKPSIYDFFKAQERPYGGKSRKSRKSQKTRKSRKSKK
jgi:hypothetical protein